MKLTCEGSARLQLADGIEGLPGLTGELFFSGSQVDEGEGHFLSGYGLKGLGRRGRVVQSGQLVDQAVLASLET